MDLVITSLYKERCLQNFLYKKISILNQSFKDKINFLINFNKNFVNYV